MKNVRSAALVSCLIFLLSLAAVGCARSSSTSMNTNNMETSMGMKKQEAMDTGMEKPMDEMNVEEMDGNMNKDMQNDMK